MLTFIMLLKSCLNLLDGLKKNLTYRFLCMPTICFWQEKKGHPLGRNELVYRYHLHVPATGWLFVSEGQNEHPSPVISSSFFLFSWEFVSLRVCGALLSVCLACLSDEILSHLSVCQRWVSERAVDELSVSGRVMGKIYCWRSLATFMNIHEERTMNIIEKLYTQAKFSPKSTYNVNQGFQAPKTVVIAHSLTLRIKQAVFATVVFATVTLLRWLLIG